MGKFDKIMIASDLDGTFLSSDTDEVARNVERIKYFTANGGRFTFATGRVGVHVMSRLPNAKKYVNAPVVTCNGLALLDLSCGRPIKEIFSDSALVVETVNFLIEKYPDMCFRSMGPEGLIFFQPENRYVKQALTETCPLKFVELELWGEEKIYKLTLRDEPAVLDEARVLLEERFCDRYTICKSWPDLLELQPRGISKAVMLEELRDSLSGEGQRIKLYAVGDYENDIEMLTMADVAVCPSNAIDSVKEIADLCLCDNDTGVIADLIDHLDR
ncbi:MAG: HAD hydrolase family protein [Clostridia bacterium]|nr:HAD hydrolase family protein [Clostridia bacterium]